MKSKRILIAFAFLALLFTSCYTEVAVDNPVNFATPVQNINTNQLLSSYELWYVDINQTSGFAEVPFLQIAFTISFRNGNLFANNNLVGIGSQGNGFGVQIGNYDAYNGILDTDHIIDGFDSFDVFRIDQNTIELYNIYNDTSYFLHGYNRNNFDYDFVFYDNIQYFMQEYEAWEKIFTSQFGNLNEFDNENYLQFLAGGNDNTFRSSQDPVPTNPNNLFWDYTGIYGVNDVPNNFYLKTLILDYDFFTNEFFELSIVNDQTVELFHPNSGTVYRFRGRNYIAYYREGTTTDKNKSSGQKKRVQRTEKKENSREAVRL